MHKPSWIEQYVAHIKLMEKMRCSWATRQKIMSELRSKVAYNRWW